jgi:1-acyl-sn-glycerol-3-phosphate acyltransferase
MVTCMVLMLSLSFYTRRSGKDAYMKIVLKDAFKRIPLFGYAMQIFGFVFLKRDAAYDRDVMMDAFSEAKRSELPVCLLLFPEGTVVSNHTKSVSREYARKNGLNLLDNVLLPRTVGVDLALNGLKGRVEHVYDVTVGYKGLKRPCLKNGYPEDILSMMNVFGRSLGSRKVYMHIRKYSVEDVASGGDVDKWIHQVYEEKDALMERFYETGKFGDAVDSFVVGPSLFDIATLCLCVVLAGGVATGMIYLMNVLFY